MSVYKSGDLYEICLVINLQSFMTLTNTIALYDCSPASIRTLTRRFNSWLARVGMEGLPPIGEWYARRVDFTIDVITPNVPHYVALAKMNNRPAWYVDRVDLDGSAYPESKSVTLNFYDKHDQIRKDLVNIANYSDLLAQAHHVFRLEVQCRRDKLKSLQRNGTNNLQLNNFLSADLSRRVVVGYYKKVMGYEDFHSMANVSQVLGEYSGAGAGKKANFTNWLNSNAAEETLPVAKRVFLQEHPRSSWYNYMSFSREVNINAVTIPDSWGVDELPNPLPAEMRIVAPKGRGYARC